MSYVFDTSSLRALQHFYPGVFKSIWAGLDALVASGMLLSTREVWNELEGQSITADVRAWTKTNKHLFTTPVAAELQFVAEIFKVPHFRGLIGKQQQLRGTPVADPFVIACARIHKGTVVTEEGWQRGNTPPVPKPNAAKIPNVCQHFGIPCIDLEVFMHQQSWSF